MFAKSDLLFFFYFIELLHFFSPPVILHPYQKKTCPDTFNTDSYY